MLYLMILKYSHKSGFHRLQKLGLFLSHSATTNLVDLLSSEFDEQVMKWKGSVEQQISPFPKV